MINSKTSGKKQNCIGVPEWIDVKYDPFVCLALRPEKSNYTFDFTFCDHVFEILLQNDFPNGSIADMHNSNKIDIKNHTFIARGQNTLQSSYLHSWAIGPDMYSKVIKQWS